MITQELLDYIKTEISSGRKSEEIHQTLISDGGWSTEDLNEAFKTISPQSSLGEIAPKEASIEEAKPAPKKVVPILSSQTRPHVWQNLAFVVIGLFCIASWYFYSLPKTNFWNSFVNKVEEQAIGTYSTSVNYLDKLSNDAWASMSHLSVPSIKFPTFNFKLPTFSFAWPSFKWPALAMPSFSLPKFNFQLPNLHFRLPVLQLPTFSFQLPKFSFKWPSFSLPTFDFSKIFGTTKVQTVIPPVENNPVVNNTTKVATNTVKDCGTSITPKLDTPSTYENNPTLSCLGNAALTCENATGILKDDFFPTVFEITKSGNSCNFKLSYSADSTLTDVTGKKLAGQYISCPVSITKAVDNTDPKNPKFITPNKTDLSKYASQIYYYGTLGLFVENNLDQNKIQALGCSGDYITSIIASYNATQSKK